MANYPHYLVPPDRRQGDIVQITTRVFTGQDHALIYSPDLFGVPQQFKFKYGMIRLTADGNAANRVIKVFRYNRHSTRIFGLGRDAITAGQTKEGIIVDGPWTASTMSFDDAIIGVDGMALRVGDSNYLDIYPEGGLAGDTWYAVIDFEYLNRKLGMTEVLPAQKEGP